MSKYEIVNQYIALDKLMGDKLLSLTVNFNKECKYIIGLKNDFLNQFKIKYENNKHNLILYYKIPLPENISSLIGIKNKEDEEVTIINIDMDLDLFTIQKGFLNYSKAIDTVISEFNKTLATYKMDKMRLLEKKKKFPFNLFHKKIDKEILWNEDMINCINNDILSYFIEEKGNLNIKKMSDFLPYGFKIQGN